MTTENNWKKKMENLEIGQSTEISSEYYTALRVTRSRLRSNGFDFTFKIGKGIITVRRIA